MIKLYIAFGDHIYKHIEDKQWKHVESVEVVSFGEDGHLPIIRRESFIKGLILADKYFGTEIRTYAFLTEEEYNKWEECN